MKWAILFIVLLAGCTTAEYATSNANTVPLPNNHVLTQQTISPEAKIPQDIPVAVVQPEQVVEYLNSSNQTSGELSCMDDCQNNCDQSAYIACTQKERAGCRASCGDIIAPSACVQACTFLSRPDVCKEQFEKFCSAQCARECY